MILKPGDKVITSKYMGTEVKIDGEQLTIVKQSDVVAIGNGRLILTADRKENIYYGKDA